MEKLFNEVFLRVMEELRVKNWKCLMLSIKFEEVEKEIAIELNIPRDDLYNNKDFAIWTRKMLEDI